MSKPARHTRSTAANGGSPIEEAYRRIAQLHYALSTADRMTNSLHQRAIDDLMDVLEILEPSMPPRKGIPSDRSTGS
jgi:hypothetical protein